MGWQENYQAEENQKFNKQRQARQGTGYGSNYLMPETYKRPELPNNPFNPLPYAVKAGEAIGNFANTTANTIGDLFTGTGVMDLNDKSDNPRKRQSNGMPQIPPDFYKDPDPQPPTPYAMANNPTGQAYLKGLAGNTEEVRKGIPNPSSPPSTGGGSLPYGRFGQAADIEAAQIDRANGLGYGMPQSSVVNPQGAPTIDKVPAVADMTSEYRPPSKGSFVPHRQAVKGEVAYAPLAPGYDAVNVPGGRMVPGTSASAPGAGMPSPEMAAQLDAMKRQQEVLDRSRIPMPSAPTNVPAGFQGVVDRSRARGLTQRNEHEQDLLNSAFGNYGKMEEQAQGRQKIGIAGGELGVRQGELGVRQGHLGVEQQRAGMEAAKLPGQLDLNAAQAGHLRSSMPGSFVDDQNRLNVMNPLTGKFEPSGLNAPHEPAALKVLAMATGRDTVTGAPIFSKEAYDQYMETLKPGGEKSSDTLTGQSFRTGGIKYPIYKDLNGKQYYKDTTGKKVYQ